nr:unnamed protein product [Callosobruchus chinensis]
MAGKAWYYNFMKRHPKLSLRQLESTSLARCKRFSRENGNHFYVILENLVDQYKIDSTKIYNVEESAREHGVILLQLPGHTTNRLQPLDVAIFKPMEVYYDQAVERWMREYPGLAVTQHQVAKLLGEAFGKAATVGFAMNGFAKCGIWPVDRHVFNDVDFAASDALLKNAAQLLPEVDENQNEQAENDSSDDDIPLSRIISKDGHLNKNTSFEEMNCLPRPGGSVDKRQEHGNVRQQAAIGSLNISFEELMAKIE